MLKSVGSALGGVAGVAAAAETASANYLCLTQDADVHEHCPMETIRRQVHVEEGASVYPSITCTHADITFYYVADQDSDGWMREGMANLLAQPC